MNPKYRAVKRGGYGYGECFSNNIEFDEFRPHTVRSIDSWGYMEDTDENN